MQKGQDVSAVVASAARAYGNGEIDKTDFTWVLRAASNRDDPTQKAVWNKFMALMPSAISNLGVAGAYEFMRSWDFKKNPQEHYREVLANAIAGPVGFNTPPKYLVNAFGFMRKLFDGQVENGEKTDAAAAADDKKSN